MNAITQNKTPALVVAGTGSGVGKTSITLGLIKALRARGLRVQPFKVGPDYLDPTWLGAAAGRQCYNLDGWMTPRKYVVEGVFEEQSRDADVVIIEGVMGLFDGASADALTGSTAEIALWLDVAVLLVIDVGGAARSAAALVKGFAEFEPGVKIAGVIANQCGSAGHADIVAQALAHAKLPPLVGWLAKQSLSSLPDRHLGLHAAHTRANSAELLTELSNVCSQQLKVDEILEIAARRETPREIETTRERDRNAAADGTDDNDRDRATIARIAVARDAAFYFYYPDNLTLLAQAGAELVYFSPLTDAALPATVDAVYVGGGYPEEYAAELAANTAMLNSLRKFAEGGGLVYGECGGLMYLSRSLQAVSDDGANEYAMVGLLPFATRMLPKRKMLGYVETTFAVDTWFGPAGRMLRGHEFHYSELIFPDSPDDSFERVFTLRGRRNQAARAEGYRNAAGNVLVSYVHQHFGSCPEAAVDFVRAAAIVGARMEAKL